MVEERATVTPPQFPLPTMDDSEPSDEGTDLRMKLGKGKVVQVKSRDELGAEELDKLIKLLEAQRDALK